MKKEKKISNNLPFKAPQEPVNNASPHIEDSERIAPHQNMSNQQGLEKNNSASKNDLPYIITICAFTKETDALINFFVHSLPSPHITFIIIAHPDLTELLPQLLKQYTPIKISLIKKQQKIQPNHIYLLPLGKNFTLHHNSLELVNSDNDVKFPIDVFLCSLAKTYNQRAICIILSGMNYDGRIGLRVLREHGCIIIAQKEKSARHYSMPKNEINNGMVDYVLLPEEMCAFLLKYVAHSSDKSIPIINSISTELHQILVLLKNQIGHDFSLYKPNTIFRRIQKRMEILQVDTLSGYVYYLHQHPPEISILFQELLINVTNFFRDPEAFEHLQKELLKKIHAKQFTPPFRVWIPGCSTGEEAYSIAIILQECMNRLNMHFSVQIFATDVDVDAIDTARAGIFPTSIEKHVSSERLRRFFIKKANVYKIDTTVRKMIIFAVQNVIEDPPFTKLHLLSCRNLLIYLKSQLQKRILPLFHYSLNSNGLLFLGPSESIGSAIDSFDVIDKRWKIYERNNNGATPQSTTELSSPNQLIEITHIKMAEKMTHEIEQNLTEMIKNILIKNYTPASVVIDEKGDIIYVHGRTGKFLEFASGGVRLHFMDMIQSQLKSKIQTAMRKAYKQQQEVILNRLPLNDMDDELKYVNIRVRPIVETESKRNLLLITLEEISLTEQVESKKLFIKGKTDKKISQLEEELDYTKENLQTTIEELETSNEELKSSNEELQSTNEELQSLNEEATTVNAELENRIEQLSSANEDIKNLLDNTEIATILLDKDLCIKRFTPKVTDIINLIATDIGRPVSHIVSNLHYENLIEDARNVLKTLKPITTEGIDKNGHWYIIKMHPYRTITDAIDGVIITFLNIHAQKKAENKLKLLENDLSIIKDFNHTLMNAISNSTVILDKNGKIILANYQFLQQFNLKNEDIIGRSIYKLKLEWNNDDLHYIIDNMFQGKASSSVSNITLSTGKTIKLTLHKISTSNLLLILNNI